ncbi:MAG: RNase adapter RapZ [Betaproteobacteria bacterium]|nr:RNase adapter RapZ [Betaproteobacteria bacterium]
MQLIIISGLSGSGKSVAVDVLEDTGFYCVDNLPAKLVPELISFLKAGGSEHVALSIDVRSGSTLEELPRHIATLQHAGEDVRVLFLDAKTDTLIKRYSETRRRHPLSTGGRTLRECIARERELLADVRDLAQRVDTSDLNPNALRGWVRDFVSLKRTGATVLFQSFGYKNGVPLDADLVFDVRCLPNPHYDPRLRPLTGKDAVVIEFLRAQPNSGEMLEDIRRFIARWLPAFERDNRSYFTVAIGCTGGRHRSVYVVEALAAQFRQTNQVLVRHRELA